MGKPRLTYSQDVVGVIDEPPFMRLKISIGDVCEGHTASCKAVAADWTPKSIAKVEGKSAVHLGEIGVYLTSINGEKLYSKKKAKDEQLVHADGDETWVALKARHTFAKDDPKLEEKVLRVRRKIIRVRMEELEAELDEREFEYDSLREKLSEIGGRCHV
jgi:hypothetical protein